MSKNLQSGTERKAAESGRDSWGRALLAGEDSEWNKSETFSGRICHCETRRWGLHCRTFSSRSEGVAAARSFDNTICCTVNTSRNWRSPLCIGSMWSWATHSSECKNKIRRFIQSIDELDSGIREKVWIELRRIWAQTFELIHVMGDPSTAPKVSVFSFSRRWNGRFLDSASY